MIRSFGRRRSQNDNLVDIWGQLRLVRLVKLDRDPLRVLSSVHRLSSACRVFDVLVKIEWRGSCLIRIVDASRRILVSLMIDTVSLICSLHRCDGCDSRSTLSILNRTLRKWRE